jgi:hypothetical protein
MKKEEQDTDLETDSGQLTTNPWASSQALIRFRQSARKIAEEYLAASGVKLSSGRKRQRHIGDPEAYEEGKKDSKNLRSDLKRRRIEAKGDEDEDV